MNPRSILKRVHQNERGQTIVVFALMFVVLLGFTAMVTDTGLAYLNRRILQNGVDSAALAGASYLLRGATTPTVVAAAEAYANDNGVTTQEITTNVPESAYQLQVTTTNNPNDTVVVSARRHFDFGLRYFVGAGNANVVATSAALVTAVFPGSGDLLPWAVLKNDPCLTAAPGTICQIKVGSGNSLTGNFGPVDYGANPNCVNSGAECYKQYLEYGYSGPVPAPISTPAPGSGGTPVWSWNFNTQTGNMAGPTDQAWTQLTAWDSDWACKGGSPNSCINYYQSVSPTDCTAIYNCVTPNYTVCLQYTGCARVGVVPILDQTTWPSGSSTQVTAIGFQCFYVVGPDPNFKQTYDGIFTGPCIPSSSREACYTCTLDATSEKSIVLWR